MGKILTQEKAIETANRIHNQNKTIVLAGGCFDILHIGHIEFFKKAKEKGDFLFIILESDETIRKTKGKNKPINQQEDRAKILESIEIIDFIVPISEFSDKDYDRLISAIKPEIIATTYGDPFRSHKERQARAVNGKVLNVIRKISNKSTSHLASLIEQDI